MADYPKNNPGSTELPQNADPGPAKKRWFGRGIYGSKDVPIRVLDTCIVLMIAAAVLLTIWHSAHGGFVVEFDTNGADAAVANQSIRYGQLIEQPADPVRPGYTLACWSANGAAAAPWDFSHETVSGDMTLFAVWQPAQITVKFDLAGGSVNGSDAAAPITVTYGQLYGALPVPEKTGAQFGGWLYSGQIITADTTVSMTGEHVLTAVWS